MGKGKEPSKKMVSKNVLPWVNPLGYLECKFYCRVVPFKARGLGF